MKTQAHINFTKPRHDTVVVPMSEEEIHVVCTRCPYVKAYLIVDNRVISGHVLNSGNVEFNHATDFSQ